MILAILALYNGCICGDTHQNSKQQYTSNIFSERSVMETECGFEYNPEKNVIGLNPWKRFWIQLISIINQQLDTRNCSPLFVWSSGGDVLEHKLHNEAM